MEMKFLTWNVWFDPINRMTRIRMIVKQILEILPEFIAFQEVIPSIYVYLTNSPLNQLYHFVQQGDNLPYGTVTGGLPYGTVIGGLIKPNNTVNYPYISTKMNRSLLLCEYKIQNLNLILGTTHLESDFRKDNQKIFQRSSAFSISENDESISIIMGDFNLSKQDESDARLKEGWKDVFYELGSPDELQYTYDYKNNPLIKGKFRSRLDRVYYKEGVNSGYVIEPMKLEFVGTENDIASDHFGLMVTFEINSNLN